MASLTGNAINTSYQGLMKTTDNAAVDPTALKAITDGSGNAIPFELSQEKVNFTNLVDFTNATVTGLDVGVESVVAGTNITVDNTDPANPVISAAGGGSPGLVSGTGTDSMQSAASLTISPASATSNCSIAIGNNSSATSTANVALGNSARACGSRSVAIGCASLSVGLSSIAIGRSAQAPSSYSVSIGNLANSCSVYGIAIGRNSLTTAEGAVALGEAVTAAKLNTVTVKELETQVAGGGVILTTPDGLNQYKITVDNSGNLVSTIIA